MIGWFSKCRVPDARGFLARLRGDRRGNTLAIMAAMLIPLCGLVGGGVDISRMYIVKTRLQHACDAGALAGRKAMGGGVWSQSSYTPRNTANQFFDANFPANGYGSNSLSRSFDESDGTVTGVASAALPMTLMRVLGKTSETLSVTCEAEMRLPNTDVMFVLDTTGSMDEIPLGDTRSKMTSMRVAVKCFYEIVARLNTDATCATDTPGDGTGNQVQVRFGFVPYSTNVNVGRLLPSSYFADSWPYQSRAPRWWIRRGNPAVGTPVPFSNTGVLLIACVDGTTSSDSYSNGNTVKTNTKVYSDASTWKTNNGGTCSGTKTTTTTTYDLRENVAGGANDQWIDYHYDQITQNVSGLKNGSSFNASLQAPVGDGGVNKTVVWDGCIEERQTVRTTDYDPIPTAAYDLNIDMVPTGDAATKWGFALRDMIITRKGSSLDMTPVYTTTDYSSVHNYVCPSEARKLQTWSASAFEDYVDDLTPSGGTYHDIGLLWGARLASPTGIFATENALTPAGGEIQRHIIFMTDGDTHTATKDYAAYGIGWFDRRQTDPATTPTIPLLDEQVDLRFNALCAKIKNTNKFTLWVIAFGTVTSDTETKLRNCATSGRYFRAAKDSELQSAFKSIADQISMLRLTR